MRVSLVAGGAGFIGQNLVRALVEGGRKVLVVDDLSLGRTESFGALLADDLLLFRQVDCSDAETLSAAVREAGVEITEVWHLAANSDIPAGISDPTVDLKRTFLTTFAILQFMREAGVPALHFASSSAIYGDHRGLALSEDTGPWEPISNYGAMKLASEAQIRAAVEAWLPRANIFRFPNVVGVPATHGVILDLVRKLARTPDRLEVLGDGTQSKPYLHVDDLVESMLHIAGLDGRHRVFNIGPDDDGASVRSIAEAVRDHLSPDAEIAFGTAPRGWVGDVSQMRYDISRLKATGWQARLSSAEAVRRAVIQISAQEALG